MGWAIIGGLISSTLLTLIVVPAAYSFVDRFNSWINGVFRRLFMSAEAIAELEEMPDPTPSPQTPHGGSDERYKNVHREELKKASPH